LKSAAMSRDACEARIAPRCIVPAVARLRRFARAAHAPQK